MLKKLTGHLEIIKIKFMILIILLLGELLKKKRLFDILNSKFYFENKKI